MSVLLTSMAVSSSSGAAAHEMLLGHYDCDEYGGDDAVAAFGENLAIYPIAGGVVLHFRRDQLPTASNSEDVVVHHLRGEDIPATSLSADVIVRLSLTGFTPANLDAGAGDAGLLGSRGVDEKLWAARDPRYWVPEIPSEDRLNHRDVYPGIDFWYFEDTMRREFDLLARPGSDLSNVSLRVDGAQPSMVDAEGNLVFLLDCGSLVLGQPRIYRSSGASRASGEEALAPLDESWGTYEGGGSDVRFKTDAAQVVAPQGYNGAAARDEPALCMVSASGDTKGPAYDYHVGKFEVTNGEFVDFLNAAEANTTNLLGANLTFDASGNVWINPSMKSGRDEVFAVAESRIVYRPDRPVGERYGITDRAPAFGESYTNHPVVGVSWFGAVKYCNWLTLAAGRGADQLCYREGTNSWDWAPVTCAVTNWQAGVFTPSERVDWLQRRGFRLLMDNCSGASGSGNAFSEFYKAATWIGTTNVPFGFGRTNVFAGDANFRQPNAQLKPDTMPVGFFDGTDHDGRYATHTNENGYGIYDLSGNVSEWVNDVGITNSPLFRGAYGGSWMQPLPEMSARAYFRPSDTRNSSGFRVASSYGGDSSLYIVRIPYYVCLCDHQLTAEEQAAYDEATRRASEEAGRKTEWKALETDPSQTIGIHSGVLKKEEAVPVPPPVTPGGGVPSSDVGGIASPM